MTGLVLNQIPAVQNEEPQLKLLWARKRTYAIATCLIFVQLGLTLGIPIIGTVLAAFLPQLKAYVAAASLAIVIIDPLILDRRQKVLMKRAAKIGEKFDCVVLDLPWDQFTVGEDVDPEDIHMAAKAFAGRCDDSGLRSWYPEVVGEVPLHLARIICQRTNLRYDSRLRRSYGAILQVVSLSLIGIFAIWGLAEDSSMTAWVLTMAPATPFIAWAAREYYRQVDTADLLDSLIKEAHKFWLRALCGKCSPIDCGSISREFQNSIYNRRVSSPLVLPFLYRLKRSFLEDEMNEGAADFLRDYRKGAIRDSTVKCSEADPTDPRTSTASPS